MHSYLRVAVMICALTLTTPLLAAEPDHDVIIKSPYVDLHTGPGRGYPITYSVEQGQIVTIKGQRTGWIKVTTHRDISGWARADDLLPRTTTGPSAYANWQVGFGLGDFNGARATSVIAGYRLSEHFTMALIMTQALGQYSDAHVAQVQLSHQSLPDKRWSPIFGIGAGIVTNSTDATLIKTQDRNNNLLTASIGGRYRIDRRYTVSLEYTNHMVLTGRNYNEEISQWTFGINAFF
jgi:uncharacterized protein YraI